MRDADFARDGGDAMLRRRRRAIIRGSAVPDRHRRSSMLRPRYRWTLLALAWALCLSPAKAEAQVYKCEDPAGRTVYADTPCARGSRKLALPNDAPAAAAGPTVCAQLQDERRRLAAETERAAKAGHPESASSARRRQALARQYQNRCLGITRSGG